MLNRAVEGINQIVDSYGDCGSCMSDPFQVVCVHACVSAHVCTHVCVCVFVCMVGQMYSPLVCSIYAHTAWSMVLVHKVASPVYFSDV